MARPILAESAISLKIPYSIGVPFLVQGVPVRHQTSSSAHSMRDDVTAETATSIYNACPTTATLQGGAMMSFAVFPESALIADSRGKLGHWNLEPRTL